MARSQIFNVSFTYTTHPEPDMEMLLPENLGIFIKEALENGVPDKVTNVKVEEMPRKFHKWSDIKKQRGSKSKWRLSE